MQTESVTVSIATLNESETLPRVLSSLKEQTYPVDEIIVVDGGSTDGTKRIAAESEATLIEQGNRSGLAAARNIGLERCSSSFFASLDGDAVPASDWIETG